MGLSASLSNALSGMNTSQNALNVVSRNVGNSGTPGYHKQSLNVVDITGANSTYAKTGMLERAFSSSLQASYNKATSDSGYTSTMNETLTRLQTYLGKPGDTGSLDTMFGNFENALQALGTSPDDYATRSTVVSQAQSMVQTLNSLSGSIQGLRADAETQMQSSVNTLNQSLASLVQVNGKLVDQSSDPATQASLMDQRDRLVAQISEQIDVQADYRSDGTVSLMTKTGIGILDVKASTFSFTPGGTMSAEAQYNVDPTKSGVGGLTVTTPSGLKLDVVQQNVLQSGTLKALVDLRDKTLVTAQSQLDQVAAGLSQAMSTVTTAGTPVTAGASAGYSLDIGSIQDGNDVTLNYTQGGAQKSIKLVRVDDPSKLPLNYLDANGAQVVGADFSAGAAGVATALRGALGAGFSVSGTGTTLQVIDDGAADTTSIASFTSHSTATSLQNGTDLGLNLFVDSDGSNFTDSLSGNGQKTGFAARITVNPALLSDNKYLVQYDPGGTLGDDDRANYMLDQLGSMQFATAQSNMNDLGSFRLGGTVSDMISQTMDYTGSVAASAQSSDDAQQQAMDTLGQRMDSEYGVNVDDEMARLLELQNAYSANARVISTVQDLMSKLLDL
jgi:flagellar hook-associated protein 1 FlgK